jgi:hypothetical protein
MAKKFDITLKQLLGDFAPDWIGGFASQLGLPTDVAVDPVDVDLSTVQLAADKAYRLRAPSEGILHFEPQVSHDGELPDRLHLYNAHLYRLYAVPVYSVALLMRPEANASTITGVLSRRHADGREYLRFEYSVIRVWQLSAELLLNGPLGMIPLSFVTNEAAGRLGEFVERTDARLRMQKLPKAKRDLILTSSLILSGLRYNGDEILEAFARIEAMKESTTYQAILQEGREEGREKGHIEARQEDLLDILTERFGRVPKKVRDRILQCQDAERLHAAVRLAVRVATPNDLEL